MMNAGFASLARVCMGIVNNLLLTFCTNLWFSKDMTSVEHSKWDVSHTQTI